MRYVRIIVGAGLGLALAAGGLISLTNHAGAPAREFPEPGLATDVACCAHPGTTAASCRNAGHAAVGSLAVALRDARPDVRRDAATALGQIGPVARLAVPDLMAAQRDTDPSVRRAATIALHSVMAVDVGWPAGLGLMPLVEVFE